MLAYYLAKKYLPTSQCGFKGVKKYLIFEGGKKKAEYRTTV